MKYNVVIKDAETRQRLEFLFTGKVGSGVTSDVVVVESDHFAGLEDAYRSILEQVEGVLSVEPAPEVRE